MRGSRVVIKFLHEDRVTSNKVSMAAFIKSDKSRSRNLQSQCVNGNCAGLGSIVPVPVSLCRNFLCDAAKNKKTAKKLHCQVNCKICPLQKGRLFSRP